MAFVQELSANSSLATFSTIGTTHEGREIAMVRVQVGGGVTNKSIIMLECGIHAREWIAPASCIWIFSQVSRISLFWQLFNCLTNLTILLTAGQRVRKQCRNHGPAQFLWLAHRSMHQSWRLWIHVEHGNHLSYYSYRLMVWSSKIERFPAWKPTFLLSPCHVLRKWLL